MKNENPLSEQRLGKPNDILSILLPSGGDQKEFHIKEENLAGFVAERSKPDEDYNKWVNKTYQCDQLCNMVKDIEVLRIRIRFNESVLCQDSQLKQYLNSDKEYILDYNDAEAFNKDLETLTSLLNKKSNH